MDRAYGIGIGRTGTRTLCKAFEILGYEPVMHGPRNLEELRHHAGAAEGECLHSWKWLEQTFPEAKFILTTREVTCWLKSCRSAINNEFPIERLIVQSHRDAARRNRIVRWGSETYDERLMLRAWYRHHADVIEYFHDKPDKLLILTMENFLWDNICPFLNRPIPDVPFPCVKSE